MDIEQKSKIAAFSLSIFKSIVIPIIFITTLILLPPYLVKLRTVLCPGCFAIQGASKIWALGFLYLFASFLVILLLILIVCGLYMWGKLTYEQYLPKIKKSLEDKEFEKGEIIGRKEAEEAHSGMLSDPVNNLDLDGGLSLIGVDKNSRKNT